MADYAGEIFIRILLDLQPDLFTGLQRRDIAFAGIELEPQAGRIGDDEERIAALFRAEFQPRVQVALDHHAGQRAAQRVGVAGAAEAGQAPAGALGFGLGTGGFGLGLLPVLVGDDAGRVQFALAFQRLDCQLPVGLGLARIGLGLPEIWRGEDSQRLPGRDDAADFRLDLQDTASDLGRHAHGAILVPDQAAWQAQGRPLVLFDDGQLEEVRLVRFAEDDAVALGHDGGFFRRLRLLAAGGDGEGHGDDGQVSLHLLVP